MARPTHASALLLWYARPSSDVKRVVELGCGSGVVSIGMAKIYGRKVVGLDIDEDAVRIARKSAVLNGVEDAVEFFVMDVKDVRNRFRAESFDMVVFNPPHVLGKVRSPERRRALSRSGDVELVEVFCKAASWLVRNRGEFTTVLSPENMTIWLEFLRKHRLEPKRMVFFHPKGKKAELVAIRGRKNADVGLIVDPPVLEG